MGSLMVRCLAFSVAVLAFHASAASPPRDPLADRVTIYRDKYGVPHIVGENEEATFFGYGYAQAEDHLERMMLQYRDAQGCRAEVQGSAALGDGYLKFIPHEYRWDGDYLQRLLRTRQGVLENRIRIDPKVYSILSAFARGINAFIAEPPSQPGSIPLRPRTSRLWSAATISVSTASTTLSRSSRTCRPRFPTSAPTSGPSPAKNRPTAASSTSSTRTCPGITAFRITKRT